MAKMDKDRMDNHKDDFGLEAFFDAGRKVTPTPSDALLSAILVDATAHQPVPQPVTTPPPRRSLWQDLKAQIGGWPALAGMATATLTGLWIGFAAPDQLEVLSGGIVLAGDYTTAEIIYLPEDLSPSYFSDDLLGAEEG